MIADPRPARLESARLTLRQPVAADLAAYTQVLGDEDGEREHRDAIAHWRAHAFGPWLIEEDGRAVGVLEIHYAGAGVTGIEPHEVEVGWTIVQERRALGLATEAGKAALDDAIARARPNHHGWLVAYIRPENEVSRRVAAKLGLRPAAEGLTRSGHPMEIWRIQV